MRLSVNYLHNTLFALMSSINGGGGIPYIVRNQPKTILFLDKGKMNATWVMMTNGHIFNCKKDRDS